MQRYLPTKGRRMVGAWCFLDHFGPDDVTAGEGMLVGPHPHTGLQTVTWLLDGEVLHVDSLGNRQTIVPGQLNLMTAGQGISHAEESPRTDRPACTGCSCGSPCRTAPATSSPPSSTTSSCRCCACRASPRRC